MTIEQPILIIGAPRSGSSMTAGVINICGAWGGQMRGPNKNNPKGMFENKVIVNNLIKPLLQKWGFDRMGQKPLPSTDFILERVEDVAPKVRNWIIKTVQEQGLKPGQKWFYKGLKMTLMWQIFHAAFPKAKWVIVRRDAEDIVSSCLRTSFMRAYNKRSGWLKWLAYHERRFEQVIDAGLDVREVWPQRMIAGDFTEMQMVINWLDLRWNHNKVVDFVDPGLWRKWKSRRDRHGR